MFDWKKKEEIHRELKLTFETQLWRAEVTAYYDRTPARANIYLWLKEPVNGVHHPLQCICTERPIASWSQIEFKNDEELAQKAEELVRGFLATLILATEGL